MADKPTYLSEVLAGRASRSDLDDWIAAWHESAPDVELHEFLGMTFEEYSGIARDPSALDGVLAAHGWTSPDVTDTSLFRILHDKGSAEQLSSFANATMTTVGGMAVSVSVTAPQGLDYRQTKVVNDLLRASMRRLVDVGCVVEIQIGPDEEQCDEEAAVDAILKLRGDARRN